MSVFRLEQAFHHLPWNNLHFMVKLELTYGYDVDKGVYEIVDQIQDFFFFLYGSLELYTVLK